MCLIKWNLKWHFVLWLKFNLIKRLNLQVSPIFSSWRFINVWCNQGCVTGVTVCLCLDICLTNARFLSLATCSSSYQLLCQNINNQTAIINLLWGWMNFCVPTPTHKFSLTLIKCPGNIFNSLYWFVMSSAPNAISEHRIRTRVGFITGLINLPDH